MNSHDLALRDIALSSLMGAIDGADFGSDFGSDWGADPIGADPIGADPIGAFGAFGAFGDEPASDYAGDPISGFGAFGAFGAAAPAAAATPDHARLVAMYHAARAKHGATQRRVALLTPNADSTVKIEGYSFDITQTLTIGTAAPITMTQTPDTEIRPTRILMNSPTFGFITISEIKVANVSALVGNNTDAAFYSNLTVGQKMSLPKLNQSTRATVNGNYSGLVVAPLTVGFSFLFVTSFQGPATVAGEGTR